MAHVVTPHDSRAIAQAIWMLVICRTKQEGGGIDCSTGDNDDISGVALGVTVAPDLDARDFATRRAGFQPGDVRSPAAA